MRSYSSGELHAIDYEYGSYNYRGYEFGNHFCEWIIDYSYPHHPNYKLKPEQYPTYTQREVLFRAYLTKLKQLQGKTPTVSSEEIQQLQTEADYFIMAPHLAWALWGIVQAGSSKIEFGYMEYSLGRIEQYFELKENLIIKYHLYDSHEDGIKVLESQLERYINKSSKIETDLIKTKLDKKKVEKLWEDIDKAKAAFTKAEGERIKAEKEEALVKERLSKAEKEVSHLENILEQARIQLKIAVQEQNKAKEYLTLLEAGNLK